MCIIKADFRYGDKSISMDFPCSEEVMQARLMELNAPEGTAELLLTGVAFPGELAVLENTLVDPDELNFLAKRMDGFFCGEQWQFLEAAKLEQFKSLKDLINLTFNLDKYTLIQNIGDMQKVGVEYTINTVGCIPTDKMNDPKYAEVGRKLLLSGKGIFTDHGLLFKDDSRPMEVVYDGQVFPCYVYDNSVQVIAAVRYQDKTEYLYLPCEDLAINKALHRLGACSPDDCEISLEEFMVDDQAWLKQLENILCREGVYALSRLTAAVHGEEIDLDKLLAVSEYAGISNSKGMMALAQHMGDFVFLKDACDYEAVGRFYVENRMEYYLNVEMEDYFDFEGFGEYIVGEYGGEFVADGFVCVQQDADLSDILDEGGSMAMGGM